jgi:hypothetical protein
MAVSGAKMMAKASRINQLAMNESSPEKAGVGGSIPSLATTFSNTYRPSTASFGSNSSPPILSRATPFLGIRPTGCNVASPNWCS